METMEQKNATQSQNNSIKRKLLNLANWIEREWFKIAIITLCLYVWVFDVKEEKPPQIVIQESTKQPVNINWAGEEVKNSPPIYVNVHPVVTETATGGIKEKTEKSNEDIVIMDTAPKYTMSYNGRIYAWESPIPEENYKFEKGQFYMNRTTDINVNLELPQPKWGIGLGYSEKGGGAILAQYRFGKSPVNAWIYSSGADAAAGLMYTAYESGQAKVDKKKSEDSNVNEKL